MIAPRCGNWVVVCDPCNVAKGSRSLASFLFRLSRAADPRAPFVAAFIQELVNQGKHQSCPVFAGGYSVRGSVTELLKSCQHKNRSERYELTTGDRGNRPRSLSDECASRLHVFPIDGHLTSKKCDSASEFFPIQDFPVIVLEVFSSPQFAVEIMHT
jgi:hypothetical protein